MKKALTILALTAAMFGSAPALMPVLGGPVTQAQPCCKML